MENGTSQIPSLQSPTNGPKNNLVVLIVIIFSVIIVGSYFFARSKTKVQSAPAFMQKQLNKVIPTPTPFPFIELTIPFLRKKQYESTLSNVQNTYENESYTAYFADYKSDNLTLSGLLTVPKTKKPEKGWPAIIFIHGYIPPAQYQPLNQYYNYVDYLARNGFVVYKLDLRGHANSEGEASGAYYSADYITDVLNAYAALQNYDQVNPNNIGLWGHSMAGNVVLRTLATKPEIPAAVIWAGAGYTYKDLQEYRIQDASYQPPSNSSQRTQIRQQISKLYGDPGSNNYFWKTMAPSNYLSELKGAIQLHHALDDNVVNIQYSRNLNKLLNDTNIPHELYEYQSGGHNITDPSFTEAMQRTVNFFHTYLK